MKKRGQVTSFIIVGIIALILVALILFLRNNMGLFTPPQDYLSGVSKNIQDSIAGCVDSYSEEGLKLMLSQGGKINPTSYKLYKGKKVAYLCEDIPDTKACINKLEPLISWEEDFSNYLKMNLGQCINLEAFKSSLGSYEIKYEGFDVSSSFFDNNVLVEVDPRITLTKGETNLVVESMNRNYDVPMGNLYDVAYNAANSEALSGEFLNLQYMLAYRGEMEVFVEDKPYPDDIYVANKKDSNYKLYFAIQGGEDNAIK